MQDEKENKEKEKPKVDMKDWDKPGVNSLTIEAFEKANNKEGKKRQLEK